MTTVVYIAGPMSGIAAYNYPAFRAVAARLRALGYTVIDPSEQVGGRTDLPYVWYMRRAVAGVLRADLVAVLRGWAQSEGARLEVRVARAIGVPVRCAACLVTGGAHAAHSRVRGEVGPSLVAQGTVEGLQGASGGCAGQELACTAGVCVCGEVR